MYYKYFKKTKTILLIPFISMMTLYISHHVLNYYSDSIILYLNSTSQIYFIEKYIYMVSMAAMSYWLCIKLVSNGFYFLQKGLQNYPTLTFVMPFFNALLKALCLLIIFNFLIENLEFSASVTFILNKISSIMIIGAIGWLLAKLIDLAQQLLLYHFNGDISGVINERKIYTQTIILKRVAYSIVSILTAGAILVLFDNVRALGASVLTTAGVIGLILTFTAQRSLASIFSGLEIALTQPIKLGDSVLIENEFGTIEEINFRNVVIKLWDWRRLVVPINFFLEKPFQNWSKVEDSSLIGTVSIYADFSLPIKKLRDYFKLILQRSPDWDKNIGLLQVGDLQERVMQIKIIVSAPSPDNLSNLQAFIREEIITYIVQKHPYALPVTRSYTQQNDFNLHHHHHQKNMEVLT